MRIVILLAAAVLSAQTEYPKPEGVAPGNGYSHVVVAPAGKLAFIAGQVANDAQGQLVGKGDLGAQAEQVFRNLKAALAAADTSFEHVIKINWYIKDYSPELLPVLRTVRNRYVNSTRPPASTLIGVASLFQPGYLIEVEAVAVVPAK